jgi:hypothetical protein
MSVGAKNIADGEEDVSIYTLTRRTA